MNMTAEGNRAIEILTEKLKCIKTGYETGIHSEVVARSQAYGAITMCRDLNLICHGRGCSMYKDFYQEIDKMKQTKGE